MKRNLWMTIRMTVLAVTGLVVCGAMAHAQGVPGGGMGQQEPGQGMMGKGRMGMGKGMMAGHPMMKSMFERSVVATSDGGVVVILGNKMAKYDKDLNLVKEVELTIDAQAMQKMMEQMKGMCPMMKGPGPKGEGEGEGEVPAEPAEEPAG